MALAERVRQISLESEAINRRQEEFVIIKAEQEIANAERNCHSRVVNFENEQLRKWNAEMKEMQSVIRGDRVSGRDAGLEQSRNEQLVEELQAAIREKRRLEDRVKQGIDNEAFIARELRFKEWELDRANAQRAESLASEAKSEKKGVYRTPPPELRATEGASVSKPENADTSLPGPIIWGEGKTITQTKTDTGTSSSSHSHPTSSRQPNGSGVWINLEPAKAGGSGDGGGDKGNLCIHGKIPQFCAQCNGRKPGLFNIYEEGEDEKPRWCKHGNILGKCIVCTVDDPCVPDFYCPHRLNRRFCSICNVKWDKLCIHGKSTLYCDECWEFELYGRDADARELGRIGHDDLCARCDNHGCAE